MNVSYSGLLLMISATAAATDDVTVCDPTLGPASTGAFAYRLRGDRCEGLYAREVSGPQMELISFTLGERPQEFPVETPLHLFWRQAGPSTTRLRATAMRPRLHYRMDAIAPPGKQAFAWQTDVLNALRLLPREIGILGRPARSSPSGAMFELVPIAFQLLSEVNTAGYEAIVIGGDEAHRIEVIIQPQHGSRPNSKTRFVLDGLFPGNTPIPIRIASPAVPGMHVVRISATFKSGGSAVTVFSFRHTGPDASR